MSVVGVILLYFVLLLLCEAAVSQLLRPSIAAPSSRHSSPLASDATG